MVGCFVEDNSLKPLNTRIGVAILVGRNKAITPLKIASNIPKGNHKNRVKMDVGVGLRANLPSWNI